MTEFPDDKTVAVLRSTVAKLLEQTPSPQMLCDIITNSLFAIEDDGAKQQWDEVAAHAGNIATTALVLMLNALARKAPKAKA